MKTSHKYLSGSHEDQIHGHKANAKTHFGIDILTITK